MPYDPQKHHRRSIRLKGYDYAQPGAYFITLVTFERECLFGLVVDGSVDLSEWGFLAMNEWRRLNQRFPFVLLDAFIVMPNHIHGILSLHEHKPVGAGQKNAIPPANTSIAPPQSNDHDIPSAPDIFAPPVGAGQENNFPSMNPYFAPPLPNDYALNNSTPRLIPASIGAIVGAYKSTTTRMINGLRRSHGAPVWQRNYYEHIIRNEREFQMIWEYIDTNPQRWQEDQLHPSAAPNRFNQG